MLFFTERPDPLGPHTRRANAANRFDLARIHLWPLYKVT